MNRLTALVLTLITSLAVIAVSAPAHAATITWQTCTPGAKHIIGAYRVFNNIWLGPSTAKFCVHSTGTPGLNITIDSSAKASPGQHAVVGYPSIRYGHFWTDLDPKSGFPLPVSNLGRRVIVHAASTGRTTGAWQSDMDVWFIPSKTWEGHGITELVVVNRTSNRNRPGGTLLWIRGVAYRWVSWMTCQRMASGACDPSVPHWRLIYVRQVRSSWRSTFYVGRLVHFCLNHGLLSTREWLGDVAYGTELWYGGKGLTDSMTISR